MLVLYIPINFPETNAEPQIYGPHCGLMWGKRASLARLTSLNHEFVATEAEPNSKLLVGGVNAEMTYSITAVLEYLCSIGGLEKLPDLSCDLSSADMAAVRGALTSAFDRIAAHEERLSEALLAELAKLAPLGVAVIGETSSARTVRVPTVSFTVAGRDPMAVAARVAEYGVGIKAGTFHSNRLVAAVGLAGVVRVSMVHYNTVEEAARFGEALAKALEH